MSEQHFAQLLWFINHKMQMQEVYQPVMLMTLLRNRGQASVEKIARELMVNDSKGLKHYMNITKRQPGRVLESHQVVIKVDGNGYRLMDYEHLSRAQVLKLMAACQEQLDDHLKRRAKRLGGRPEEAYRSVPITWLELPGHKEEGPGTDRAAHAPPPQARPAQPGMTAAYASQAERRLDSRSPQVADPRIVAPGATPETATETDPGAEPEHCVFCEADIRPRVLLENNLAMAVRDRFPVTELHTLIIPKRHVTSYFELERPEQSACNELLEAEKWAIQARDDSVTGFNVGVNVGRDAGQTIPHCHIHLIPRRHGDMADPRGGVRGVIPEKQRY